MNAPAGRQVKGRWRIVEAHLRIAATSDSRRPAILNANAIILQQPASY
jgi:hypothetical protein